MKKIRDFVKFQGALKHLAFDPKNSKGRRRKNDEDLKLYGKSVNPFQLDVEKIRLSMPFRRLSDKTHVFPPDNPNITNRLTHTIDVVSASSFLSLILGLNQFLVRAIAYGHDIGHCPFGHLGERIIGNIAEREFSHAFMGVIVAEKIARDGKGLNLSYETLQGILSHSRGADNIELSDGVSQEASILAISDKVANTFANLDDAVKVGEIREIDVPKELLTIFGKTRRERIANTCYAIVRECSEQGCVSFSQSEEAQKFIALRKWMYKNVYQVLDEGYGRKRKEKYLYRLHEILPNDILLEDINIYLLLVILTDSEAITLSQKRYGNIEIEKLGFYDIVKNLSKAAKKTNVFEYDLNPKNFSVCV